MHSMTGFGQGAAADAGGRATVQISAVNNRSLAIHLRSDLHDVALEEVVRQELRTALVRGSVNAQVSFQAAQSAAFDRARLSQTWRELAALASELGAPAPTIERVAALLPTARQESRTGAEPLIRQALAQAVADLVSMRAREGAALARDLAAHVRTLRTQLRGMVDSAAGRTASYRESLSARLREVLQGQAAVTPELLVRELALHAERIDVSEELVRFAAHLDALESLVSSPEDQIGRKLEFLLQECAREVNTTGAKANDARLTAHVLETKHVLEQMREQAANIA
ncbi:MAG: DUF1732 domain-containing protein [Planctomycetes bacterium]|nr:DUF1732 domain-containing protein [Planctomycetota bacterium]